VCSSDLTYSRLRRVDTEEDVSRDSRLT